MRFDQLADVTGGTLVNVEAAARTFSGVSIDSRTIQPGQLFFAIRGEKHDGHVYLGDVVKRGAGGVVIESTYAGALKIADGLGVVAVPDSHQALITLAGSYRAASGARFAAITGSNGKTTTKEFAYRLVRAVEQKAYQSPGNLNNLFGAPLALLAMAPDVRVAVMEMGISTPGEMTRLASIVRPEMILVTNVGPSHLEFLHTVEEVARAKLELVQTVPPDAPLIVNADDPVLMAEARKVRDNLITFAVENTADITPESIQSESSGVSLVTLDGHVFRLPLAGRHQVYNLVAAYALFKTLGYRCSGIDTLGISLQTAPMRGQIVKKRGVTFLADCYNANPDSVKAGLTAFFDTTGGKRRIVILGDMLELGAASSDYHKDIGRFLSAYAFDLAVFVGKDSVLGMKELRSSGTPPHSVRHYDSAQECAREIAALLREGDFVFVKASRGIGLEAVIAAFNEAEETS